MKLDSRSNLKVKSQMCDISTTTPNKIMKVHNHLGGGQVIKT